MSNVAYVVPVYGKPGLLMTCLSTFRKFHPDETIVVSDDGGPDDDAIKQVCAMFKADYFRKENGGFASACNFGISRTNADYVCLVNSDIEFTENTSERLIYDFEKDPDTVIVGARLFYPNGLIQHGGGRYVWNQFGHYGHGRTPEEAKLTGLKAYRIYVTGALMAIRKDWWKHNNFDETYFNDSEDVDLCLRAWTDGKRVLYDPLIEAIHAEGMTRGANDEEKRAKGTYEKGEQSRKALLLKALKFNWFDTQNKMNALNKEMHPTLPPAFKRMGAIGDVLRAVNVFKQWGQKNEAVIVTAVPEAWAGFANPITSREEDFEVGEIYDLDLAYERNRDLSIESAYRRILGLPDAKTNPLAGHPHDGLSWMKIKKAAAEMDWDEPYVVVHMGVSWPSKTLPGDFWQEMGAKILSKGYTLVCVGAGDTLEAKGQKIINLVNKTDLSMLRALLEKAKLFIGPDSGVLHMADGACPAIGLFTCALPEKLVSDKVTAIVTKAPCAGCLHRQPVSTFHLCDYPQNDPRHIACAYSFNPYEVADKALEILEAK